MFYPLQSFGYQSRLISSNLCMLSLLGLNYVGSEHDRLAKHLHLSSSISHRGANNSGIATSVLTLKQNPPFSHNDSSLSIRITFQQSLSETIHTHSYILP